MHERPSTGPKPAPAAPRPREIVVGDPEPQVVPPPTPTTPSPAPVRTGPTGVVIVKSVPDGAIVREKGKGLLEKSGAGYVLSMGSHLLELESPSGEKSPPIPVVVKNNQTVSICFNFDTNKGCAEP